MTFYRCAPSILITFINMVLFKTQEHEEACETGYMYGGQGFLQHLLVIVSVLCIPWMLLVKPFLLKR